MFIRYFSSLSFFFLFAKNAATPAMIPAAATVIPPPIRRQLPEPLFPPLFPPELSPDDPSLLVPELGVPGVRGVVGLSISIICSGVEDVLLCVTISYFATMLTILPGM